MTAEMVDPVRPPVLDPDVIVPPEPVWAALRRRLSGRYPVDPFGLVQPLGVILRLAIGVHTWAPI